MAVPLGFYRSVASATILAAVALLVVGCQGDIIWPARPGPKVVVSFAPIACFAMNVAGDDAIIKSMMTTTGPHDFNPTNNDARMIHRADLFLINGLALDNSLAESLKRGSGNRKLKLVALGEQIPADKLLEFHEQHPPDVASDHHHEGNDPHVWLSPSLAIVMVEGIREELKTADPAHSQDYEKRAGDYIAKLRQLQSDGEQLLAGKKDRKLVTFHESLSYFAHAFGLTIEGVVQKKPGVEPNTNELSQLIALCQEKQVRLIAVEPQYSSTTSAASLLKALKRKNAVADPVVVQLDPLETAEVGALTADWYERKMRANLQLLAEAMK